MEEHSIDDPAGALVARVHGADVSEDVAITPESAGSLAISWRVSPVQRMELARD